MSFDRRRSANEITFIAREKYAEWKRIIEPDWRDVSFAVPCKPAVT